MLKELVIKNIVLIKLIKIEFKKGLSVLTGETGTGKSILLDSLGLIAGNKVDFNLIRHGENSGSVTAIFDIDRNHPVKDVLKKYDIDFENELIVRRLINTDGKSKCIINDTTITKNALTEIIDYLLEIQGQFEDRGLLNIKTHLSLLDSYANHNDLIQNTKTTFNKMRKLEELIKQTEKNDKKLNEESEWINDAFNQLTFLDPKKGEEEQLHQKKQLLNNREKIFNTINNAKSIIEDDQGLEDLFNNISKSFEQSNLNEAIEIIYRAKSEIEELKVFINRKNSEINESYESLEAVDDRLHELRSQSRKHSCSVDDLVEIKQNLELKISNLDKRKSNLNELKKDYGQTKQNFVSISSNLSESRKKSALKLAEKINKELPYLKLNNAHFEIKFENIDLENCSSDGIDKVTFYASTNTGIDKKPINKIASGWGTIKISVSY